MLGICVAVGRGVGGNLVGAFVGRGTSTTGSEVVKTDVTVGMISVGKGSTGVEVGKTTVSRGRLQPARTRHSKMVQKV
jgi:hypothetical protein